MGDTVHASVSAVNNVGVGDTAFSMSCDSECILADPPNPPIDLKTDETEPTDNKITFTWSDPNPVGSELPITGYKVYDDDDRLLDGLASWPTKSFTT